MLIFEGSDCLGKSTAADKASAMTGWPIQHMGIPQNHSIENYVFTSLPIIQDRFHLGATVYGDMLNLHDTNWTAAGRAKIQEIALRDHTVVILLSKKNPEFYDTVLSLNKGREEAFNRALIKKANDAYHLLRDKAHFVHDVSVEGFPGTVHLERWIAHEIRNREDES